MTGGWPSGTGGEVASLALLFTDLVDSTALATRAGPDGAERLRREHFSLLRSCIGRHGGREVKNLGDGLMVAFETSSAAVAAAVESQQRLELRNRSAGDEDPLVVRMGLSAGEVDVDEDDVFGAPVITAARLCDLAAGGQVLVSAVVPVLVGGRGGVEFESLGDRELKGMDAPVEVFEVPWEPLAGGEADGPPVPLPDRLASATTVFAGREREIDALRSAWEVASTGALGVAVVSGEAGIGKTTLVGELARALSHEGAIVLHGGCEADLGVPFRPWIELLDHLVTHLPGEVVSDHVDECGPHLAMLLPAVTARSDAARQLGSDLETERYRVFGAVADLLRRAAEIAPLCMVLEDVHWADVPSLQLLRHLVTVGGERALVVVTSRSTDVDTEGPLPDTLAALHRGSGPVEVIELVGLDADDLLALMQKAAGHPLGSDGARLRDALAAETAGNPFFVVEILRHLAESGAIDRGSDDRWSASVDLGSHGLPVNVQQVVGRRVARLGRDAERILRAAAVVGREIDVGLLAEVLDIDDEDVVDVVDAAVESSLVIADGPERFRFAHALVGRFLYDSLTPPRRARLHRRVAAVLEQSPDASAAEQARHLAAGGSLDDVPRLIDCAMRAGDEAIRALAPAEAMHWYRVALDSIEERAAGDDAARRQRCEVMIRVGDAERQAGDPSYRERLLAAADLAKDLGDGSLLVAAALANSRGVSSVAGQVDGERVGVLERALVAVGTEDSASRARLLATLCSELAFADRARADEAADEAIAVADRCGDAGAYADVIALTTLAHSVPWKLDDRDLHTARVMTMVHERDEPARRWRACYERRVVHLMRGDRDAAALALDEMRAIVQHLPMPYLRHLTSDAAAVEAVLDGDLRRAERLAAVGLEQAMESGQPDAVQIYGTYLFTIRYHEGRAYELVDEFASVMDDMPGLPMMKGGLAAAHVEGGSTDRAKTIVGDLAASAAASERDFMWSTGMVVFGDVALGLGDRDAARWIHDQLLPYAGQIVCNIVATAGAVAHRLGCLAALLGRTDRAVQFLEDALEQHRGLRAPIYVAMSAVELSRLLADVDPSRSAALAVEAEQIRIDHGLAGFYGITGRWPLEQ